jgi:hypothetical protein
MVGSRHWRAAGNVAASWLGTAVVRVVALPAPKAGAVKEREHLRPHVGWGGLPLKSVEEGRFPAARASTSSIARLEGGRVVSPPLGIDVTRISVLAHPTAREVVKDKRS